MRSARLAQQDLQGYKTCKVTRLARLQDLQGYRVARLQGFQGHKACKVTRLVRLQYVQGDLTDKLLEKPTTKNNIYEIFKKFMRFYLFYILFSVVGFSSN